MPAYLRSLAFLAEDLLSLVGGTCNLIAGSRLRADGGRSRLGVVLSRLGTPLKIENPGCELDRVIAYEAVKRTILSVGESDTGVA